MKLPEVISQIESDGNQFAVRFEIAKQDKAFASDILERCKKANNPYSKITAQRLLAFSWGEYQIMGFNLYGFLKCSISVGAFMADRALQRSYFETFCRTNNIWIDGDVPNDQGWLEKFAKGYNGSGDIPNYTRKMRRVLGF